MKLLGFLSAVAAFFAGSHAVNALISINERPKDGPGQTVVWDEFSLKIGSDRIMIMSGEVHPFRLPVPSLYPDIFQKIRALGFNTVSFYVDWALLEGQRGKIRDGGIFDLDAFFDAAVDAGIYLMARPGPHINAQVSGGGFPGWMQTVSGTLRTDDAEYLNATGGYMSSIASKIAKAQITNGGPVILYQAENEYSHGQEGAAFPNPDYLQKVVDQARNHGIVVPLVNNDAGAQGIGNGSGRTVYHADLSCGQPNNWPPGALPSTLHEEHVKISVKTPLALVEFQGGSYDSVGGHGFEKCAALTNHEYERVFFKNNIAAGVKLFNVYMMFGGTNWGNLGLPGSYTSYDYGACIGEDRSVDREKYSELKLQGQFLRVSPGYLLTKPGTASQGVFTDTLDITVTPLLAELHGHFFVIRHTDYAKVGSIIYKLRLPTSAGNITIPQLPGSLSLSGRDSKIHVTDYPVGDHHLLYCTAEIFTWRKFAEKTVLILHGAAYESHELAFRIPFKMGNPLIKVLQGEGVKIKKVIKKLHSMVVIHWMVSAEARAVVQFDNVQIYLVNRNSAYNYWVPTLPTKGKRPAYGSSPLNPDTCIVNGGHLIRSIDSDGSAVALNGDFNLSTTVEIIGLSDARALKINGQDVKFTVSKLGNLVTRLPFEIPDFDLPDVSKLDWHYVDSLPEIRPQYNDALWPVADRETSNSAVPLKTPVSLYGSDYGFHTGALLFRGYFTAPARELDLKLTTQGGVAFAHSVWVNGTFVGSFKGAATTASAEVSYHLKSLNKGGRYILTVVVDNTGLEDNVEVGSENMKSPRGILDYTLSTHSGAVVSISPWKITGNLGGEAYRDKFRGPLNEGGLSFERLGYHLPSPPPTAFKNATPFDGISQPGIAFYWAKFTLNMPDKYDCPLSFVFENSTIFTTGSFRALLYVNGFQYGRYINHIGPQTEFHVPEGILNYKGDNYVGVSIWAMEKEGARIPGLKLENTKIIATSRNKVEFVKGPSYRSRARSY